MTSEVSNQELMKALSGIQGTLDTLVQHITTGQVMGGKGKSKRKSRPKGMPKQATPAHFIYINQEIERIVAATLKKDKQFKKDDEETQKKKTAEARKAAREEASTNWRNLDESEKAKYRKIYEKNKKEADAKIAEWETAQQGGSSTSDAEVSEEAEAKVEAEVEVEAKPKNKSKKANPRKKSKSPTPKSKAKAPVLNLSDSDEDED